MEEWKEYKLGEIADITPGFAFKSLDFGQKGEKVVKIKDITPPIINLTDCEHVDLDKYDKSKLRRFLIKQNDYVVAMTGATIGKIGKLKVDGHAYINQRVAKINAKEGVCADFVYYALCEDSFQLFVQNNIDSNSAQENISASSLGRFSIFLPSFTEQKRIASILRSLDDKIDLLHQENKTLEAMAETLFRQWFIEEVKEDWKEGTLDDILSVKGGTTPSTKEPKYWDGSIPWTSPKDVTTLNGIYLFDTERKITQEGLKQISSGLLPAGTLLMSSRAPVGVLAYAELPLAINQGYIAIIDDKGYAKEFIYLWLKANMDMVHSYANGSTFMEISKSAFKSLSLLIPPKHIVDEFCDRIKPIFEKIKINELQIRTINKTKDNILPKLMSNEIKIDEL